MYDTTHASRANTLKQPRQWRADPCQGGGGKHLPIGRTADGKELASGLQGNRGRCRCSQLQSFFKSFQSVYQSVNQPSRNRVESSRSRTLYLFSPRPHNPPPKPHGQSIRRETRRSFPSCAAGQSSSPTSARFNKSGPDPRWPLPCSELHYLLLLCWQLVTSFLLCSCSSLLRVSPIPSSSIRPRLLQANTGIDLYRATCTSKKTASLQTDHRPTFLLCRLQCPPSISSPVKRDQPRPIQWGNLPCLEQVDLDTWSLEEKKLWGLSLH